MSLKSSIIHLCKISKDVDKLAMVQMVGDQTKMSIFITIAKAPIAAKEIMRQTKIPQTSLYRSLTWLLNKGLIRGMVHKQDETHNEVIFYAVLEAIHLQLDKNGCKVNMETVFTQ